MFKLNKTFVESVTAPGWYRDSEVRGFCLRVGSKSKVFAVNTKVKGSRTNVTVTIGPYPVFTAEQARVEARKILAEMQQGIVPKEKKAAERAEELSRKAEQEADSALRAVTLGRVLNEYLAARSLKPSTTYMYRCTVSGALDDWLELPIQDITKDMVEKRHKHITNQGHKGAANSAMRILRALITFAMAKYEDHKGNPIVPFNPVVRLSQTRTWNRLSRRQTVLKAHQLRDWCAAVYALENETVRDYLLLLLFTGLRKTEAASLLWKDIDLRAKTILIPDVKTKNSDPHMLPLPDFLVDMLRNRERKNEFVFGADNGKGHIYDIRFHIGLVERNSGVSFMLHDLRRTFLTIADSLDLSAYAIKRLANHKTTSDVTAGYIVSDAERLREPMNRICQTIRRLAGLPEVAEEPILMNAERHRSRLKDSRLTACDADEA